MKVLFIIFLCSLYAVLNVTGAAVIKGQLKLVPLAGAMDYFYFLLRPMVILGFVIIMLSALTLFTALKSAEFSFVVPLSTGVNFVLTILIGLFVFNDKVAGMQYVGLALILAGIVIMSLAKPKAAPTQAVSEAVEKTELVESNKFN